MNDYNEILKNISIDKDIVTYIIKQSKQRLYCKNFWPKLEINKVYQMDLATWGFGNFGAKQSDDVLNSLIVKSLLTSKLKNFLKTFYWIGLDDLKHFNVSDINLEKIADHLLCGEHDWIHLFIELNNCIQMINTHLSNIHIHLISIIIGLCKINDTFRKMLYAYLRNNK